jgi:GT2 family glycosyltransferase
MKTYVVIPQFLVNDELVQLAEDAIKSFRVDDVFIISVDDCGEFQKAERADEVMALSDLVIKNEKNSGFAITCNNGFKWIFENEKDDCYIVCANNDIVVNKKTIQALKDPFEMFDNVAITGIISTMTQEWEGKPLEEMDWRKMSENGMCGDRMQDGGLWCSKKTILLKLAVYRKNDIM